MVGLVDDSNGQTDLFDQHESEITRQKIIEELKNNAQLWAELLGLTGGGALELSKCSYQPCHGMAMTGAPTHVTDSSGLIVKDPVSGKILRTQLPTKSIRSA
jgi:hypothetical protein